MSGHALEQLAAELALGLADARALVDGAVGALASGLDSPALVELAGLAPVTTAAAEPLFRRALAELGIPLPDAQDAVMRLARASAVEIGGGTVAPYDGAKRIWQLTLQLSEQRLPELDPFIYAASEWEDRPADRDFFDAAIRSAAATLAGG